MDTKTSPQSQPSLGIFGILKESLKTANRNFKLLLPILLIVFVLLSQLDFTEKYILAPVAEDFSLQYAKHPNMFQDFSYNIHQAAYGSALQDLREILLIKLSTFTISSIISLIFVVATVSSSSEAYIAKVLGPKDASLKVIKSWKRPLVTSFYMTLITMGVICLYVTSIGIVSLFAVSSMSSWAYVLFGVIFVSIPICYFYVAALWMVSVVVSVLEDGFGGLQAIGRGAKLMKGKRVQAWKIMVIFGLGYGVVHMMTYAVRSYDLSRNTLLAITIPFTNYLNCLLKLYMFVVFTVFYHERKTSVDAQEEKGSYVPIASGEV